MNVYKPDLMTVLVLFVIVAVIITTSATMSVGNGDEVASRLTSGGPADDNAGLMKTGLIDKSHSAHRGYALYPAAAVSDLSSAVSADRNEQMLLN